MEYLELRIMQTVEQHIHTRQVKSGYIFLLSEDFAYFPSIIFHLPIHIEQQRTGTAGEVKHIAQFALVSRSRVLTINTRQNSAHLLRSVELTGFLATSCGKLTNKVFVCITQNIGLLVKLNQVLL